MVKITPKVETGTVVRSTDLGVIAMLLTAGFNYEKIEKNGGQVTFIFVTSGKELEIVIADYWNNKVKLNPLAYYNNIKSIKHLIHNCFN